MSKILFELQDVYFSYLGKFPALRGIDMTIEEAQKIAIIGANGSGKSTLLHLLDGLIFADKGRVTFLGSELSENFLSDANFSKTFRRRVGFVFQNPDVQLFCPTVREDIVFGPLQLGVEKGEIKKHLEELVSILGIQDLLERAPHQLSIGEKRKAAIASSLIMHPDILILDEPTAGLDPLTSRQIVDTIIQLNLEGKTIITATHDLHIVGEIADLVYVFNKDKRIAGCASSDKILKDTEFLRINNLVHIHSHSHQEEIHTHPHPYSKHHIE